MNGKDLTLADKAVAFSRDQIDLIKRTIAKGATDDELRLFLAQCERTGLDPFDRQIYFMKRRQWNAKTDSYEEIGQAQTSIDGFRVIAERTGEMDGQEVAWCDENGAWTDVWLKHTPPFAARVLVYRKGCAKPFPGIARYDEYVQTKRDGQPNAIWTKMGANQLAKCAEALGIRKAFPKQLSGLYTIEEMGEAKNDRAGYVVEAAPIAAPVPADPFPAPPVDLPNGAVVIVKVQSGTGKARGFIHTSNQQVGADGFAIYDDQLFVLASECCQAGQPVYLTLKSSASGRDYIKGLRRAGPMMEQAPPDSPDEARDADIPF